MTEHSRRIPSVTALIGWLALCFSAAATGAFVSVGGWYSGLNKPPWNPPAWLFGPVWTILYLMMAVSAWLVWKRGGWTAQRKALSLFLLQLFLNSLWTPLFFGLQSPGLALVEISFLWLALLATVYAFSSAHRPAALLLLPYLAWTTFAAFLNFTIWRLNP